MHFLSHLGELESVHLVICQELQNVRVAAGQLVRPYLVQLLPEDLVDVAHEGVADGIGHGGRRARLVVEGLGRLNVSNCYESRRLGATTADPNWP